MRVHDISEGSPACDMEGSRGSVSRTFEVRQPVASLPRISSVKAVGLQVPKMSRHGGSARMGRSAFVEALVMG